jgi:phosphohistidine phosphatase
VGGSNLKTLYLYRHAKSSWKDPTLADFERPLKGRGRRAAISMAAYMAEHRLMPDIIVCSSAVRTRETLEILRKALGGDIPARIDEILYMASAAELLRQVHHLDDGLASAMLVGHNPGLQDLALRLTGGGKPELRHRMRSKFPTAALAVFTSPGRKWRAVKPGGATLKAFVCPRDFD